MTHDRYDEFLALHHGATPLLLPNPWDVGSATLFASLGYRALATTSSGFAATLGRLDGSVTRDEALAHAATIAAATDLLVNGDFENCFADDTNGVAETVRLATGTGLAGCSIEDFDPIADGIYERARGRTRRGRGRGRAHVDRAARAHGSVRELPPRAPRPGRHDRAPAGIPGRGRRRGVRARV